MFDLEALLGGPTPAASFHRLASALQEHMDDQSAWLPIHGDFTVDNVLVDAMSGQCCGVIDFDMAQLGPRVADIAWSAWRSARSSRDALTLEAERLRRLVRGYATTSGTALPIDELLDWLVVRGDRRLRSHLR